MSTDTTLELDFETTLFLEGLLLLVCTLTDAEERVLTEALRQLATEGYHEDHILGVRVSGRTRWAETSLLDRLLRATDARVQRAVLEHILGEDFKRITAALEHAGVPDLAARMLNPDTEAG